MSPACACGREDLDQLPPVPDRVQGGRCQSEGRCAQGTVAADRAPSCDRGIAQAKVGSDGGNSDVAGEVWLGLRFPPWAATPGNAGVDHAHGRSAQ